MSSGLHQNETTSSKDKIELVTDQKLPLGVAQVRKADGTYAFAFDPGFKLDTSGSLVKQVKDYEWVNKYFGRNYWTNTPNLKDLAKTKWKTDGWFDTIAYDTTIPKQNYYAYLYEYPRGYGKSSTLSMWQKSIDDLGKSAKKASSGLEALREANDVWGAKLKAAEEAAKAAISEERVHEFMEQNYLPYDYARNILEEAYKDSILNEGKTNGSTESPA